MVLFGIVRYHGSFQGDSNGSVYSEAVGVGAGNGSSGNKMPTLEEYGTNLTGLAEEVRIVCRYRIADATVC